MSEKIFAFIKISEYLSLIQKDSVTHMHGLAVYVKEGLSFPRELLLIFSSGFTSLSVRVKKTKWLTHYLLAELKEKFTILHLD